MAKINSRQKGSRNERVAAAVLTEWTGVKFHKVPASGALDWGNWITSGDVVTVDRNDFPFFIETKHYRSMPIFGDLRKNSKVRGIYQKALEQASKVGREPMLMIRVNGMPKSQYVVYVGPALAKQIVDKYQLPALALAKDDAENLEIVGFDSFKFFALPYKEVSALINDKISKDGE